MNPVGKRPCLWGKQCHHHRLQKDNPPCHGGGKAQNNLQIQRHQKADGKGGNLMIKLELTIPPTDESMMTQKFTAPIKVYDFIVFPCDASGAHKDAADMCKIKANNFMKAAELVGKENSAVADLVGKTIGIVAKQQSDDYGDKLVVSKYREGTLKAAENIPF